ncbi:MAG: hypothetical protein SFW09_01130 [Hyphomicrobiaceae bacterium]|nr:hypothetical protein [Hyphomicrobiaceae bacterium]
MRRIGIRPFTGKAARRRLPLIEPRRLALTGAGLAIQPVRPFMMLARLIVVAGFLVSLGTGPARAQGKFLAACSRGNLEACYKLLARPRLDAGRRAAIEFHLAELEALIAACAKADAAACATLTDKHPDLPPDLSPQALRPSPQRD